MTEPSGEMNGPLAVRGSRVFAAVLLQPGSVAAVGRGEFGGSSTQEVSSSLHRDAQIRSETTVSQWKA